MATYNEKISQAVEGALEQIKNNAPGEFYKMNADPKLKATITEAARYAAEEELKLAREFASRPDQDIRNRLAMHLPEYRVKLIEEALSIPTFRMEINKKRSGNYQVDLKRGDEEFLPSRELRSLEDIDWAKIMQYASIVVEGVMLVLQAVGIKASVSSSTVKATVEDTAKAIQESSVMQKAIQAFIKAWKEAGGSASAKAKAIFFLLKNSYGAGILWKIIKSLCSNMSTWDWIKTAATVTAMIIASLATDGVALIAKIALAVVAAADFAKKIANVVKLEEIQQTL